MAVTIGYKILNEILRVQYDPHAGVEGYEGTAVHDEQYIGTPGYEEAAKVWDAAGRMIQAAIPLKAKEVIVTDGTTGRDGESLEDHFIPESQFPPGESYEDYYREKQDKTVVLDPLNEFDPPDEVGIDLTTYDPANVTVRSGFRLVITDTDIKDDSIIPTPSFIALDRNEDNNIPDDYLHRSPGRVYIISQKSNELQLFVEYKSCWKIRYLICDLPVNENSVPTVLPYEP